MPLLYYRSDELPAWVASLEINGNASIDFSTGYTFAVALLLGAVATPCAPTVVGGTGSVTVAWADADLDVAPAVYKVQLTITRTADGYETTIEDRLTIKPRAIA